MAIYQSIITVFPISGIWGHFIAWQRVDMGRGTKANLYAIKFGFWSDKLLFLLYDWTTFYFHSGTTIINNILSLTLIRCNVLKTYKIKGNRARNLTVTVIKSCWNSWKVMNLINTVHEVIWTKFAAQITCMCVATHVQ